MNDDEYVEFDTRLAELIEAFTDLPIDDRYYEVRDKAVNLIEDLRG